MVVGKRLFSGVSPVVLLRDLKDGDSGDEDSGVLGCVLESGLVVQDCLSGDLCGPAR